MPHSTGRTWPLKRRGPRSHAGFVSRIAQTLAGVGSANCNTRKRGAGPLHIAEIVGASSDWFLRELARRTALDRLRWAPSSVRISTSDAGPGTERAA